MRGPILKAAAVGATVALLGAACIRFGREPQPPDALRRYLDALVAGDYRTAYDLTQLEEISKARSTALAFDHFAGFWRGSPLLRYEVRRVTELKRIPGDRLSEGGTPLFIVDVDLVDASARRSATFSVEGEVLGRVTVDPTFVLVRTPGRRPRGGVVDGARIVLPPTPLRGLPQFQIFVLPGRHRLQIDGVAPVEFSTDPVRAHSGPARVEGEGAKAILVVG